MLCCSFTVLSVLVLIAGLFLNSFHHQVKEVEGLTMDLLVPGTLVNARVRAVLKNGLLLSFLTYFSGMVSFPQATLCG